MEKKKLIDQVKTTIQDNSFVKMSLANYHGADRDLKKILIKKISVKREEKINFTYRHKTRDTVKNYAVAEAIRLIEDYLTDFHAGSLFIVGEEISFQTRQGRLFLKHRKDETILKEDLSHDREKKRIIDSKAVYLHELGIADTEGKIYKNAQDKFRQIDKYIEIIRPLVQGLDKTKSFRVADMGSGKGYLTFALYDYAANILGLQAEVTGVEFRTDMVDLCNSVAEKCGYEGLRFVRSSIEDYRTGKLDMLVALHACDTATDDAIIKAVNAEAEMIVVAPCCHKQVRREMEKNKPANDLSILTKHGIFLERHAEMVTDGLRALVLDYLGYQTKVFEFISDAHTPKNVMIVAVKSERKNRKETGEKIRAARKYFGVAQHPLDILMPELIQPEPDASSTTAS